MSAHPLAPPRLIALVALLPLLAVLVVHAASAADPSPTPRRLDAAATRRGGVAVTLQRTPGPPAAVLEVRAADGGQYAGSLLDVTDDGATVALAEVAGPAAAVLVIARADGTQLRVEMPGLINATFSADGGLLAAVDGRGRLWAVDVAGATTRPLADGPFINAPLVEDDGTTIALAVPSIEAPFQSRLVAVDPAGNVRVLSDEELVYDAARLSDGRLVAVAHRPEGTILALVGAGPGAPLASLGPDAVNVSFSADAGVIAWETAGRIFARANGGPAAEIGAGSEPAVSADGSSLLISRDGAAQLIELGAGEVGRFAAASALLACEECGS